MNKPTVLVVDNGSLSIPRVRRSFETLGADTDLVAADQVPDTMPAKYAALVLSGTKKRAYERDYYRRLIDLVYGSTVPVWGICGGMQIIATAAGAVLEPGRSRVGTHEVHVDKTEAVFAEAKPTLCVFQRHMLYVKAAPEGFKTIGHSADAPVEFIRSDDGRIYGSQAHLEFREDGLSVLRGFVSLFK